MILIFNELMNLKNNSKNRIINLIILKEIYGILLMEQMISKKVMRK